MMIIIKKKWSFVFRLFSALLLFEINNNNKNNYDEMLMKCSFLFIPFYCHHQKRFFFILVMMMSDVDALNILYNRKTNQIYLYDDSFGKN